MSKTQREFVKFLKEKEHSLTEYEKKLSNIILSNFSEIESVGNANGKRGKLLARLVSKEGDSISSCFSYEENDSQKRNAEAVRLTKLKVKNFRGFSDEHILEFKNLYTFVYGPNGTGKSSFCEALEYNLLGTIIEADAKRIDISDYINNAITGKGEDPILMGRDAKGKEIQVLHNFAAYEFCFFESNRITGFARVSANTPQAQQQRLAALFGLEDFNNFVNQFNEKFDYDPIDCIGVKAEELKSRLEKIQVQKDIVAAIPPRRMEIEKRKSNLLQKYPSISTIEELKELLLGNAEIQGSINQLNNKNIELKKFQILQDPGIENITTQLKSITKLKREQEDGNLKLSKFKSELSLRDLYTSILKNQEKFPNTCPACESPLYRNGHLLVPIDPFANAKSMLKRFEEAIQLESNLSEINKEITNEIGSLKARLIKIFVLSQEVSLSEKEKLEELNSIITSSSSNDNDFELVIDRVETQSHILASLKSKLEEHNQTARFITQKIEENDIRIKQLQEHVQEIAEIIAAIKSCDNEEQVAKKLIEEFNETNKHFIEEVNKEKQIVYRNVSFRDAYYSLKRKLLEYNHQLPSRMVKNLNARTLEIYNQINRYDTKADLLVSLELPVTAGENIRIRFKDSNEMDALHVLSEGHIRCLGLAILLAKNIHDNLPFIIFDDVVNAIDDEHRRGIVETITENEDINTKQLIVTTHGEEFMKQLENSIPSANHQKLVTRIDFLEQLVPKKISIKLDSSRNYLVLAKQRLAEGQVRDSLANSRRALESILIKLWKRLENKKLSVQVSVSMRSPNRPPELMSIATGLNNFIKNNKIEHFYPVSSALDNILGNGDKYQLEWNFLNKGTHEEERSEEFDKATAKLITVYLEQLDTAVN